MVVRKITVVRVSGWSLLWLVLGSSVAANGNGFSLSAGATTSGKSAFSKIGKIKGLPTRHVL